MVAVNIPFNFFLLLSILCFVHSFRIQYQSNSGPLQLGRKFGLDQRSKHVVSPSHQHPSLQKQAFLKNYDYMNKRTSPSHIYTTFLSNQLNENDESNPLSMKETDQILIGGAGTLAAIVTLYSEFVLKTTGCGLPAGPFGLVGAIEGISYLAIVGIVAYALFIKVKTGSGLPAGPGGILGLAEGLSFLSIFTGLLVLGFQIMDYGYIPNAVPMEGGMCQ